MHWTRSQRCRVLNGEWNFKYLDCPLDIPDSISDIEYKETLPVPSCWECYGYGQVHYTNINYPFQYDLPYTYEANPVGIYSRKFAPAATGGRQYLVFEGVRSYFEWKTRCYGLRKRLRFTEFCLNVTANISIKE